MIKYIICKMKKIKIYKINKKDSNSFLNIYVEYRISVRVSICILLSFG